MSSKSVEYGSVSGSDADLKLPSHIETQSFTHARPGSTANLPRLSALDMVSILYVTTCAGPFGIEVSVRAAGSGWTFIGLFVVILWFCIPQSLMVAELSAMMPVDYGAALWVKRGLGDFWGFLTIMTLGLTSLTGLPLYPILLQQQISGVVDYEFSFIEKYIIRFTVIILGALFASFNVKLTARIMLIISVVTMIPFAIAFFWTINDIKLSQWTEGPPNGDYDWALFICTLLWMHTGWDAAGILAGETQFNPKQYFSVFGITNVIDFVVYASSIIPALTLGKGNWNEGYFVVAFNEIHYGLGTAVSIVAVVTCFSQYYMYSVLFARMIWALAHPNIEITNNKTGKTRMIVFDIFPPIFRWEWTKTGAPIIAIAAIAAFSTLFAIGSFAFFIKISIFLQCTAFAFEYTAFLKLRYDEPNIYRPYKVPFGMIGAWTITILKLLLVALVWILMIIGAPISFLASVGVLIFCVVYYFVRRKWFIKKTVAPHPTMKKANEESALIGTIQLSMSTNRSGDEKENSLPTSVQPSCEQFVATKNQV